MRASGFSILNAYPCLLQKKYRYELGKKRSSSNNVIRGLYGRIIVDVEARSVSN